MKYNSRRKRHWRVVKRFLLKYISYVVHPRHKPTAKGEPSDPNFSLLAAEIAWFTEIVLDASST